MASPPHEPAIPAHARQVLESIGALVIATTLEGELEFGNQPVLEYFGKTIEQLKGWRTSGDVLHPDDLANAIAVWKESIEKGVPYDVDYRFRRSDGVYRVPVVSRAWATSA